MSLNKFQSIVLGIMILGILAGAAILAVSEFRSALGDTNCPAANYWNSATQVCQVNSTNTTAATSNPLYYNSTNNWLTAASNLSSNAGTAGTLFGVGLIVLAAFAIFMFMGRRGGV